MHIAQGPERHPAVLPLGIVASINGSVRHVGKMIGMASRRDAATAEAKLALYVEKRGGSALHLVATMGMLEVPGRF